MLSNVENNIFLDSPEVNLLPIVSAEWNQNLFNPPHVTVAGNGIKETVTSSATYTNVTDSNKHPDFVTKSFALSSNAGSASYSINTTNNRSAYKIVFYAKSSVYTPIMLNANAKGNGNQYGSSSVEINSYGWTKVEVMMGGASSSDAIDTIAFKIVCNTFTNYETAATVYFTVPEVYENQYFNYQYNSLWPTDAPFSYFRPGESYIPTGNSNVSIPTNFRKVTSNAKNGFAGDIFAPVSSILENPQYLFVTQYNPFIKNTLPTDISPYKYFVSEASTNPAISAIYPKLISSNKLVLKFNTSVAIPNISVALNGSTSSTVYSGAVPSNGVLILYYNGSSWSTNRWTSMPAFGGDGVLSPYMEINQITVKHVQEPTLNSNFPIKGSSVSYTEDLKRMHLIEVSPRLEIDLTDYVQNVSITKQLDSKSTLVPLSTINTDDASIALSGIPVFTGANPVPLFSNQSNSTSSILANMLRKNIKFYLNWKLLSYTNSSNTYSVSNTYIPAGVFYSDSWEEQDIDSVKVQCFDIIRYLQTLPVSDYVANYKTVFDIISTMLDRSGFTDYDIDSLYAVTNDPSSPMDLSYYYANSQDTTVAAALTDLFLAYQIGAYIDEYGVMRFLSLANILNSTTSAMTISDNNIYEGGYSVSNVGKVGKISLRYQQPKIKQTLALQNATDPTQRNSPSFIYTTSTAQPWISQTTDAVGFNYLNESLNADNNYFKYNVNDLLDIFHTFNLNTNGYVAIENEIMSFNYKEYSISVGSNTKTVSVKNDIELASEVDRFVKGNVTPQLNVSDGNTKAAATNVIIAPTGRITNVQRGLFGTSPVAHTIADSLSSKSLSQAEVYLSYVESTTNNNASVSTYRPYSAVSNDQSNPGIAVINCNVPATKKVLIYPTSQRDDLYHTYSTKFNFAPNNKLAAAGLFFGTDSINNMNGAQFVEIVKNYLGKTTKVTGFDESTGEDITQETESWQYLAALYAYDSSSNLNVIAWTDITGMMTNIVNNFEKVLVKKTSGNQYSYEPGIDACFHLKVIHYNSDGTDGENSGEVVDVFVNNAKIVGWQTFDSSNNQWKPSPVNALTGVPKLPLLQSVPQAGDIFGAFMTTTPVEIPIGIPGELGFTSIIYNEGNTIDSAVTAGSIRELYATQAVLKDRSTNYWYQTNQFLNGMIQNQNIFNIHKSYIVQTQPSIVGINVYDVQYQTPAATNVDILPIEYYQLYFPNGEPADNQYRQELIVDEHSLAYSTPLNTGFRAKWAIANNSPFLVWIHKEPDQLNQTSTHLVIWTHEIVAQSDPAIIEKVLNRNNMTEVAQVDSQWIQSSYAAEKMIGLIAHAMDGFSRDTTLKIFGNPLIQLGDIITVTYKLTGINQQKFVVQSVRHSFNNGLETDLVLNAVGSGIQY
jgi:hypothetical protein